MAKYAISEEGITCLEKLSQDLKLASANIDEECMKLYNTIESLEEGLLFK